MLKIAICDDSPYDVEILESAFDQLGNKRVEYDIYFSADELLTHIKENGDSYQMYILDIEMPGKNGLELAREIRKEGSRALIVFLTNYMYYVMDVFEVFTFDFVIKPISVDKLESVIEKAMKYLDLLKQKFVFKYRKNQFSVNYDDILYIAKRGRQAMIYTPYESYKTNMTTEELWQQLDRRVFSHIHASYIINLQHIQAIQGNEVVLDDGEHFIVSRSHKQELKEKHLNFISRQA
ncbi:MAG: response regulator transcription factor [Lachnospiraceae bacterium]|nr:response regulator transcription factor [Lachnospiraceae bacterium]